MSEPLDPRAGASDLTFEFHALTEPGPGQRWSTWLDVEPLCRGPEPRPDWVITSQAAFDTELGVLKTGKEAEVHLVERAVPGGESVILAAKRYRSAEHRDFTRSAIYTDGRRTRRSRDARALAKQTAYGRSVAAGQWAWAEWQALVALWSAGVAVPYPVQIDGTELLLELITDDDDASRPAPRLAQSRPDGVLLAHYFDQVRESMMLLARAGWAHGDLSAYNLLATGSRLVLIDLPQIVDLAANPAGFDLLLRDCVNVCRWFQSRGLAVDEQELYAELVAAAW